MKRAGADRTDWTRGARRWLCGKCKAKRYAPPALGSRTPTTCTCGAKSWTPIATPRPL